MNKLWILSASSSTASIYSVTEKNRHFHLVKKLPHAESRLKNSDLVSDRPGHYAKNTKTLRGSFAEPTDHKTLEAERFASELSDEPACAGPR